MISCCSSTKGALRVGLHGTAEGIGFYRGRGEGHRTGPEKISTGTERVRNRGSGARVKKAATGGGGLTRGDAAGDGGGARQMAAGGGVRIRRGHRAVEREAEASGRRRRGPRAPRVSSAAPCIVSPSPSPSRAIAWRSPGHAASGGPQAWDRPSKWRRAGRSVRRAGAADSRRHVDPVAEEVDARLQALAA